MFLRKSTLRPRMILVAALVCSCTAVYAADKEQKKTPAPSPGTAATVPESARQVIARVNGQPIYAVELRRAEKAIMSSQPGVQIPADRQKEFDQQALNQIISAELLYQAGQKLEIKDIDKQVADKLSQSKARFPSEQEFEKAIASMELSPADLTEYSRRDIVIANFIQQTIASKTSVSDEETRKFYDENQDKFNQGETIRASHILIGVDAKASDAEKKKAREKAEKLRKQLTGGADFAALAKENSTCPSSQQGGDLGYFGKGQMVPPFEKAAFGLKKDEISDVVETSFGYHIIKLTDKKPAEKIAYEVAKPRIEGYLKNQKISSKVSSLLEEKRKEAKIEILMK